MTNAAVPASCYHHAQNSEARQAIQAACGSAENPWQEQTPVVQQQQDIVVPPLTQSAPDNFAELRQFRRRAESGQLVSLDDAELDSIDISVAQELGEKYSGLWQSGLIKVLQSG